MGGGLTIINLLTMLAEVHALAGRHDRGLSVLDEAVTLLPRVEDRFAEPELYRVRGELLLMQSPGSSAATDEAGALFLQARDTARVQRARFYDLRAATSLGRLWHQQGRPAEARELVSSVYDSFTEGFETPDLADARALLALSDQPVRDAHSRAERSRQPRGCGSEHRA